jgi:hypothetical protein
MARFVVTRRALPLLLLAALTSAVPPLFAQDRNYGAPILLLPVGAHAVGQGEAAVADTTLGTESLWWNAAGLARQRKREIAVHHSQTAAGTSDMLAAVFPSRILGTLAASAYIVDFGSIDVTGPNNEPLGTSTNRYYLLNASYATPVGKRLSAGISAKLIMLRFVCSGCGASVANIEGTTSAFDLGTQYVLPTTLPVTLGASIRNLGPKLQVHDAQQADPLPRVLEVGAKARVPNATMTKNDLSLDVMGDVFASPAYKQPTLSVGANLAYHGEFIVRGGYKSSTGNDGAVGGFSAGFGVSRSGFEVDFARHFDSVASQLGQPPTYVSLRFKF